MKQAFVRGEEYYFVTAPNLGFKADWSSVIRLTLAFLDVRFSKPPTTAEGRNQQVTALHSRHPEHS